MRGVSSGTSQANSRKANGPSAASQGGWPGRGGGVKRRRDARRELGDEPGEFEKRECAERGDPERLAHARDVAQQDREREAARGGDEPAPPERFDQRHEITPRLENEETAEQRLVPRREREQQRGRGDGGDRT